MLHKLVVNIYEPRGAGLDYPVVQHVFFGRTKAEADGYYRSHLKTDSFLRGCVTRRRWERVECEAELHWERG